jgi:hypothetical protein
MIGKLTSLFGRGNDAATPEPVGETVLMNVYSTLLEIVQPTFAHRLHARRDLSDAALLTHLHGFSAHVLSRGDGQMSREKYHVILHVQRVQQHLSIAVAIDGMEEFYAWAASANAILFTEDGNVTDPQGRVLVSAADGKADPDAQVPYPDQALARQVATEAALERRGVIVPPTLPPLVCEAEVTLQDRDEVVGRARALLLVALRAQSVASGEAMPVETLLAKMPLADDHLSPREKTFLAVEAPSREDCAQFIWNYEGLYLLEWALGLVDTLPYPDTPCDAAVVAATLIDMRGPALRPVGEVLDALDVHYRLHWFIRQARLKGRAAPAGIDADVVMQRHHALNWLVRFQHAGWDEVDTPT